MSGHTDSKRWASICVSAVFLVSLATGVASAKASDSISTDPSDGVADWSVLVYLQADNDLDPYTDEDLQELRDGGSSEDVNVLVLVDRLYEPAYLLCVEGNELLELESLGEIDTGDPATLRWFVEYSDRLFPAEHMLLFFWDHGTPTAGVGVDTTVSEESEPGTDWAWLSHHDVVEALAGHHVDIVATDECSIGQMETLYEYWALGLDTDYFVASESYIGWRGFSYDKIVQRLVLSPTMDARELSLVIVEEFTELFSVPPYQSEILTTQSVFDMSKISALGDAVIALADGLAADIDGYRDAIGAAQLSSIMPWGARLEGWIDFPTFVEELMGSLGKNDPVLKLCEDVMDAYGEAMIGMGVAKNTDLYGYKGMGILFPQSYSMYTVAHASSDWGGFDIYSTFVFPNMGWWQFLETYWGV